MNSMANIWQQPKTSVAGLLIAVVTVAGVLQQQGISLGALGSGSVVTLVGALAAALLGLLARDPDWQPSQPSQRSQRPEGGTAKLGAWMLIAILVSGTLPTAGCSKASVAQNIVNWTPALESAVATVGSLAATLDPADALLVSTATVGFNAASNLLAAQANAYLANPSASTLTQLQNQVVVLEQQVNASLLQVAKISNPTSQQHAITSIQAVATVVMAILALVQSVSSPSDLQRMSAAAQVKLAEVAPLIDHGAMARLVAAHYDEPAPVAAAQVEVARLEMVRAGF